MATKLDDVTYALSYCKMRIRQLENIAQCQAELDELRGLKREYRRLKAEVKGFQMTLWQDKIYA